MLERKPLIFLLAATAVILIGTAVTMVAPFSWINDDSAKIAAVKPYTPLQLEGRDIYIREGCNNCHTQTVRPLLADTERYGEYSKTGEFAYDQPFLWGSRRTGPDLARIGGKYPDVWHHKHMADPQAMVPRSNMPSYAFLQRPLDSSLSERKMRKLGFPYTAADLQGLQGKTEMDAMVAYLQKLGNDIPWRTAAATQVVGDLTNPFAGKAEAAKEGAEIYARSCAQCHGDKLGGGIGPKLAGTTLKEADLFKIVFSGRPDKGMPAFGDSLGKDRVWKIVTHIMTAGH